MADEVTANNSNQTAAFDFSNVDWSAVATITAEAVSLLLPLVNLAGPAASVGIQMAAKIVVGVLTGVPEAIKLWEQIQSGKQPSPQDLIEYANSYEAAYQELNADIAAKIAAKQAGVSS